MQVWESDEITEHTIQDALINNCLHIGTDGSHIPETFDGAGAAIVAPFGSLEHILKAGSKCHVEHGMSSLTTEQYGIISGLIALHVLLMKLGQK